MKMRNGITVAGNIMVDNIKHVNKYPRAGMLTSILELDRSVGGVLGNTIVDLAIIDPTLRLQAMGCVGDDENGCLALEHLKKYNINTSQIQAFKNISTSFTDVFQDRSTGQRTFFTFGGANDEFSYDNIDFKSIDTDIFHIGYALLLRGMDSADVEYGTVMAKTLAKVQALGIKTSMDIVSEDSPRAADIIRYSVKYCNYFIVNEEEASTASGVPARNNAGQLIVLNMKKICEDLFEQGVKDLVVVHCPEGGFAMDKSGRYYEQPSFHLPDDFIVGSVGAGDAFCAGMLYGIYNAWDIIDAMAFANGAAAACLQGSGGTTSMRCKEGIFKLMNELHQ